MRATIENRTTRSDEDRQKLLKRASIDAVVEHFSEEGFITLPCCTLGPDQESSDMTTRSNFQQVETIDTDQSGT